ncbi:SMI1/KNR4 family protein [Hymenobacter sp. BT507]|uniref:SMI1/KNR4 family protein n=1 Tax=Hymenobacter citatus TaxID=2763506 RepID=A0ABR7MMU3_9BACT|nr:SMI1/KNR4 family protein [Hymenobacter citatus]MBC6611907.1 SMI1/KNR4 family protein [Hymenobacter citatus]
MMTPAGFVESWNQGVEDEHNGLVAPTAAALEGVNIPDEAREFLLQAGLPYSAAPFVDFGYDLKETHIKTLAEVCGITDTVAHQLYYIGSTGSGDPICISSTGKIWFFNHDNDFEPFFINSSIAQLAACLLLYRQLLILPKHLWGKENSLEFQQWQPASEEFAKQVKQIDPEAYPTSHRIKRGYDCMWPMENQ